jgi:hypothetical protein
VGNTSNIPAQNVPCQRPNIVYGGGGRDSNFMLNSIWKCAELDMYILHHCPKIFCHLFVGGGGGKCPRLFSMVITFALFHLNARNITYGNHIFGAYTFGSPPLNSCTKICGPPLNWCSKIMTHPFRSAKDTSVLFFCCQIIPLQYSIAIQMVKLKFRASFKDV